MRWREEIERETERESERERKSHKESQQSFARLRRGPGFAGGKDAPTHGALSRATTSPSLPTKARANKSEQELARKAERERKERQRVSERERNRERAKRKRGKENEMAEEIVEKGLVDNFEGLV